MRILTVLSTTFDRMRFYIFRKRNPNKKYSPEQKASIVIAILVLFILIPFMYNCCFCWTTKKSFFLGYVPSAFDQSEWFSFWVSYIGIIIGAILTIASFRIPAVIQESQHYSEQVTKVTSQRIEEATICLFPSNCENSWNSVRLYNADNISESGQVGEEQSNKFELMLHISSDIIFSEQNVDSMAISFGRGYSEKYKFMPIQPNDENAKTEMSPNNDIHLLIYDNLIHGYILEFVGQKYTRNLTYDIIKLELGLQWITKDLYGNNSTIHYFVSAEITDPKIEIDNLFSKATARINNYNISIVESKTSKI